MREIKFRAVAKCKYNYVTHNRDYGVNDGDFVVGYYYQDLIDNEDSNYSIHVDYIRMEYGDNYADVEVDGDTVGQFTGMLDANGAQIYEGDVVFVKNDDGDDFIHIVQFDEESCAYIIGVNSCDYDMTTMAWARQNHYFEYEVIGNIHQNKELLGE